MKNTKIKLFVMDVDWTLTNGHIYLSEYGELCKAFNVKDGYGISSILPQYSIIPVIITGRESTILKKRCEELKIHELYQNCLDKLAILKKLAKQYNLIQNSQGKFIEVAYIGDDLNDLPCILSCVISACPNDAINEIKKNVTYICSKKGGEGAVREFIEWLIFNFYES